MRSRNFLKRLLWTSLVLFFLLNLVAYFHAYSFTHFNNSSKKRTTAPETIGFGEKLKTVLFGVSNPRPVNTRKPEVAYETVTLAMNNETMEAWLIEKEKSKGTVILFHGYGGEKSAMLGQAAVFRELGFNTFLIDFIGTGGSSGNATTIGYHEAEQVSAAFKYIEGTGEENIVLFGTSMGAVAIMKAMDDHNLAASALLLEYPFGTMLKTVQARFKTLGIPSFPMSQLLVFWGGTQHGFNAFGHNPEDYAKRIMVPTLLLYGEQDKKVSRSEIDLIYENLGGTKQLKTFEDAGHENLMVKYEEDWIAELDDFLNK